MRVMLTDTKGNVSWELKRSVPDGYEILTMDSRQLDSTDKYGVRTVLQNYRPNLAIYSAAYTSVDKAELDTENAYAVHAYTAPHIDNLCSEIDVSLVQISRYFIDWIQSAPFKPDDVANPHSAYCARKGGDSTVYSEH